MLRRSSLGRTGTSGPPRSAWPVPSTTGIARISTSGGLTEFPVAANSGAGSAGPGGTGLAVGSDGDIWFILANSADIGRITPSGSVSYVSPGASDFPTAIAEGPDGNIWVAEYNSQPSVGQQNEIARVTPESTVTQFVVPNAPGYAGGPVIAALASGPGGELWFGSTAGYLGHMTTSGTVGYLPLSAIAPYGIASEVDSFVAGPAGDLWFLASIATSGGTDAVGHLAADGSITAFPTQIDPGTMTIGPDGNLWITQRTGFMAAYVERVTPAGSFSKVTTQLHPNTRKDVALTTLGIATGSDGDLWITEAPGEHGPGSGSAYDVVRLTAGASAPGKGKPGHKAAHKKATSKPKPKSKPRNHHPKAPAKGLQHHGKIVPR